ncbi:ubiquitin carboxyl-terminal hydrolase 14 isoform X2 [Hydra vulgaris]|uniref:Ubiquitin carboxyl-terminal hydrolase n=1 Tax=Hydra vulgaris TaxID=6087 RepID=A0ABM4CZ81_HYDVU
MATYSVHVKWGKEKFDNVEVNTAEPPELFQAQLFALSGVPIQRQKIMGKGKTLKNDTWDGFTLKDGMTLLMMGSNELVPTPQLSTKFIEDMSSTELNKASSFPAGLTNLGNTCYMNATIQCLKNVPELKQALERYDGKLNIGSIMSMPSDAITISLRDLYNVMNKTSTAVPPIMFLQVLHAVFPHFAEKSEQGGFMQQDANECWTQLIRMLQQRLPPLKTDSDSNLHKSSFIDQYFGISFKTILKCDETDLEAETTLTEHFYQLSCFISQDIKYLNSGLKSRLKETITKASPVLGKDASYTKSSLISRLPAYLTIQFVRFFYKEKEKVNAKILKDIKFPMTLDVFELCSSELQEKLKPMRDKFKEEEDKRANEKLLQISTASNNKKLPFEFSDDIGSNNSGYFELSAVLTHRGRSSSSGHYVAWIRKQEGLDEWLMCDDDNVYAVTSEDILKLSGGGDWHCAYVLLYSPKSLIVADEKNDHY